MARTTAGILKILSACALIAAATIPSSIAVIAQESKALDLPTLKAQFDQTIRTGDQPGALKLAMQMIAATEPEHIEALYAAAQLHARMGNREQAYLYLNRAIGAGFADRGRLREDEAFTEFRDDDLFKTLVRRAWARGYFDLLERPNHVRLKTRILKTWHPICARAAGNSPPSRIPGRHRCSRRRRGSCRRATSRDDRSP